MSDSNLCDQSWPPGIAQGRDIPCRRGAKHSGAHQSIPHNLSWAGKLTQAEREQREILRAREKADG